MQQSHTSRTAFTLVEIAIVLVVIGLLVGAVTAGSAVIGHSRLQNVIATYSRYAGAVAQFNKQYGGMPGDIIDATNYWGKDTTNCNGDSQAAGTPGTCNGDNNGVIGNVTSEPYRAWQHLQLAKLIETNMSGLGTTPTVGVNVPSAKITGSGWGFYNNASLVGGADCYNQNLDNFLSFGNVAVFPTASGTSMPIGGIITPADALQIDQKIDDSMPATGRILALKPASTAMPNCTTSATDASAAYNVSLTTKVCGLLMSITTK